jgi:hypothetical protein
LEAIRKVAATAESHGDWWIATAGEVADWWRKRAGVRISALELQGEGSAIDSNASTASSGLRVENPSNEPIVGLWIDVVLPGGLQERIPSVDGVPVSYTATEWGLRIPLGTLAQGEARVISFQSPPS